MKRSNYPFTAVLGQDKVKNALIWNMINPSIGGVLISGEKGTAKSTLVRAMGELTTKNIVELPLNITEERLIGGIDFERAIKDGKKVLEKGLLCDAHQNILYIDEVNLLSDSIVKVLLEVAGNGFCNVEREGVSGSYESEFILIGSMNPEESELRSQFLDRFGLYVDVHSETNPKTRMEIIRRRIAYEANPESFIHRFIEEESMLRTQIEVASKKLNSIKVSEQSILFAADLAKQANCEGHRAEIILIETAKAISAFTGLSSVNKDTLLEAVGYVFPHRSRELSKQESDNNQNSSQSDDQPQTTDHDDEQVESDNNEMPQDNNSNGELEEEKQDETDDSSEENRENDTPQQQEESQEDSSNQEMQETNNTTQNSSNSNDEEVIESDDIYAVSKWLEQKLKKKVNTGSGKRSIVKTDCSMGRYVRSRMDSKNRNDIAFDATVRAAAPYQVHRLSSDNTCKLVIKSQDIRLKVRERRTGNVILFVVDASASMGVGKRMAAVKGAILSLLSDAYQKRDKVGLITFRRDRAELNLPITHSVELAKKEITDLPTGGKTPLCIGLELAHSVMRAYQHKEKDILPVIVLISDGRATYGFSKKPFDDAKEVARTIYTDKIHTIVIDAEQDFIKLGLAEKLATEMEADLYRLDDLRADTLVETIQHAIR